MKFLGYVFLFFIAIFIVGGMLGNSPPTQNVKELTPSEKLLADAKEAAWTRDVLAMRRLRDSMKNPKSFELSQAVKMDDGSLCVEYRATNSFNAVVPGQAVVTSSSIVTSDSANEFKQAWNTRCAGKSGESYTHIRRAM